MSSPSPSSEQDPQAELLEQERLRNLERAGKVSQALMQQVQEVQERARHLARVKSELAKLDGELAKSIGILRSQIEEVGKACSEAQLERDRAHAVFQKAEERLTQANGRKAMLASHLDYIILTNERRKAEKLASLEEELGLDASRPAVVVAAAAADEVFGIAGRRSPRELGEASVGSAQTPPAQQQAGSPRNGSSPIASPPQQQPQQQLKQQPQQQQVQEQAQQKQEPRPASPESKQNPKEEPPRVPAKAPRQVPQSAEEREALRAVRGAQRRARLPPIPAERRPSPAEEWEEEGDAEDELPSLPGRPFQGF